MSIIPEGLVSDVYSGVKEDFKRAPWLWSSITGLWLLTWGVYLWVYPNLAQAGNVKMIEQKVDIVLRITMENTLKDLVKTRCDSPSQYYWVLQNQIRERKEEYEDLTKRKWVEPSCEEARR